MDGNLLLENEVMVAKGRLMSRKIDFAENYVAAQHNRFPFMLCGEQFVQKYGDYALHNTTHHVGHEHT
jgi:hypothetical protein